jgi:CRISPR-associated protein Cas2
MKIRRIVNSELSLVAYDIPDDRRRRRVADSCSGFGTRLQWSVFECWTDPAAIPVLRRSLEREIDPNHDELTIIPIPKKAIDGAVHLGQASWHPPPPFWIIGHFDDKPFQPP